MSVDTTGGTLGLHPIYPQSHGDAALGKLRGGVWSGDVDGNAPLASGAWGSSPRSLGCRLALDRVGGFAECPTRPPRGNQKGSPSNIGVIAMRAMDIARLLAKCVAVGGKVHLVAGPTNHRPVVCGLGVGHSTSTLGTYPISCHVVWNIMCVD